MKLHQMLIRDLKVKVSAVEVIYIKEINIKIKVGTKMSLFLIFFLFCLVFFFIFHTTEDHMPAYTEVVLNFEDFEKR